MQASNECTETKCLNGICLPTYSIYLIGLFYFILSITIAALAYLLYLNKVNHYQIMKTPSSPEVTLQRNYSAQISNETSGINLDVLHKKKSEENYPLHVLDENTPQNQQNDHKKKINISDRHYMITKELKQHRPLKNNGNHCIMLKDEINKICQNELSKSQASGNNTSLKDLHKLIYEESKNIPVNASEKSASTSQLDEFYDELPKQRPVNQKNIDEANIMDQYYDEVPKGRPVNQDNIDVANIPMYDCLPTGKTVISRDSNTDYLVPISRRNVSIDFPAEPEYVNAHY